MLLVHHVPTHFHLHLVVIEEGFLPDLSYIERKRMAMYLLRKSLEVVKVVSAAYQAAIAMASSSVS